MEPNRSWAVVTGASSGLGIEFARALAAAGRNVVLTARREAPMQELAKELEERHQVSVVVEALDLSQPGGAEELLLRLDSRGIVTETLINNAGFGISSPFIDQDSQRLREMLQLDIVALTELSHLFAQRMAAAQGGHILLVASMAAYQPTPLLAAYGAAKAYVLSLGEALNVELAEKGVKVTVVSPGLMETGFSEVSGFQVKDNMRAGMLKPAEVARIGLKALAAGKSGVAAGTMNRLMTLLSRFLSRHTMAKMVFRMSAS